MLLTPSENIYAIVDHEGVGVGSWGSELIQSYYIPLQEVNLLYYLRFAFLAFLYLVLPTNYYYTVFLAAYHRYLSPWCTQAYLKQSPAILPDIIYLHDISKSML